LLTCNILEMSQGRAPECASSTIFWRVESGSGRPPTKTPPSWFTPLCPANTKIACVFRASFFPLNDHESQRITPATSYAVELRQWLPVRMPRKGCEKFKRSIASEDFPRFDEQYRCHHRSCIFPPLRASGTSRKPEGGEGHSSRLVPSSSFLLLGPPPKGTAKDVHGGLVARVVTSANPIVDNLRLIVSVTRQTHTLPPRADILYSRGSCTRG